MIYLSRTAGEGPKNTLMHTSPHTQVAYMGADIICRHVRRRFHTYAVQIVNEAANTQTTKWNNVL